MLKFKRNNKGFTLVELLVVVAIIGILVVVAVPNLFKSIQKANISELESEISSIKSAVLSYYAEESDLAYEQLSKNIGLSQYLEEKFDRTYLGGTYWIVPNKLDINNNNYIDSFEGGYKVNENKLYEKLDSNYLKDNFKVVLALRYWDSALGNVGYPKITKDQFEKLAKDIGYDNVFMLSDTFKKGETVAETEIYIGLIAK